MTIKEDFKKACEAINGRIVKGLFGEMVCRMEKTNVRIMEPFDALFVERWGKAGHTSIALSNLESIETSALETKAISKDGNFIKINRAGKIVVSIFK